MKRGTINQKKTHTSVNQVEPWRRRDRSRGGGDTEKFPHRTAPWVVAIELGDGKAKNWVNRNETWKG